MRYKRKQIVLVACALGLPAMAGASAMPARDASTWLTVAGDPHDTDGNTVQVDPVAHGSEPRRMQVRVSRSGPRISWDGVPYRSYVADVLFDCTRPSARYLSLRYHLEPVWKGEPHRTVDYTAGTPRMMEFREMRPNPTARIIAAACASQSRPPAAAPPPR